MSTTVLNIDVEANTDFILENVYVDYSTNLPVNLAGYSAVFEVRENTEKQTVLLHLTNVTGDVYLGNDGVILVKIKPSHTNTVATLQPTWHTGLYDLVLVDATGVRRRLLKGFFNVVPNLG